MARKNYGYFMALPENEFSTGCLEGAHAAAAELDANLYVFPHGLINGLYIDQETTKYRYQYNTLDVFFDAKFLDGIIVEYGTIVSDIDEAQKAKFRGKFADRNIVLLAEETDDYRCVCFDNGSGLKDTIRHLIDKHNCQRIGFISGPRDNHDAQERLNVYIDCMKEYNLEMDDSWIGYGNFSPYCHDAIKQLCIDHPDIEAIVFANDGMAMASYEALPEMGRIIGKDILITGFDDAPSSVLCKPALTSVKADPSQMAYEAVKLLANGETEPGTSRIPTHMISRQSCGCENKLIYDINGVLIGSEIEEEFKKVALGKIEDGKHSQHALAEQGYVLREVVFNQNIGDVWLESLMDSLERIGARASYLFMYDPTITNDDTGQWKLPETINLRARKENGEIRVYKPGERVFFCKDILANPPIRHSVRGDMIIVPLFYRDKQLGMLCVDSDPKSFHFIYRMAGLISNTIQMALVQAESERIQKQLLMASQAKSQFLANMSHEIRTPINAIMGMNEMILRESENAGIMEYASEIKTAAVSLLSLVNDILDLTKIEEGKMELVPVDYSLVDVANDALRQMEYRIEAKDIKLVSQLDKNIPAKLHGDDNRVRQVLINLLTNAVKYTEKGTVTLKITSENKGNTANIRFQIIDTGIGIKEEDLAKLFEKFVRIEESRNRNIEGTGLGLNITIGLLELMGSRLEVSSIYNEGSTFSFELKQEIVNTEPVGTLINPQESGKKRGIYKSRFTSPDSKILVVDDNSVNRKVISHLLKATGIQTREAENGQVCLERLKEESFDLILLDHMMPVMDGVQTLEAIRSMPEYMDGNPPIIVLTANAIKGVEQGYLDSGFDAYLSKPVSPTKLEDALLRFLPSEKIIYN